MKYIMTILEVGKLQEKTLMSVMSQVGNSSDDDKNQS